MSRDKVVILVLNLSPGGRMDSGLCRNDGVFAQDASSRLFSGATYFKSRTGDGFFYFRKADLS